MTPEQFRQVEDLFHRGKGLPPDEQRALLDAECGDDAEVRTEVEKLLAQADPDETLADLKGKVDRVLRPGGDDPSAAAGGPAIEGYEIIREIHRGGQGVVYQAIQKSTKRKVAIKVLLEGPYASKSARRRFEREIELVAQLKHPNIIGIFHSGQTSDGRQYCVMDYVRGVPLDQYVHDNKSTLEDALQLFAKVCEAVNYAHQKGVIHRDLKPSNILVDADGEPKVLDFGLAKQLVSREASLISLTGQVVGTLPYMSPEQAEGNPDKIDIRTDVYALGVILYQMLTGHYPYPVAGQMAEVLKHIAETPPTPPSRSWKSDSGVTQCAHRRIRPGQCPIDDEVQTIVLRTLAKERDRRYQSAGELAKDVGHYLADEPIEAKRDSGWYVFRKSLHRYRMPVAVVAGFVVLVAGSAIALAFLSHKLAGERDAVQRAILAEKRQRQEVETRKEAERALVLEQCRDALLLVDPDGLHRHLDKAVELGIPASTYHCYRGWAHALQYDFDEAWKELDKAVDVDAGNAEAYYLRAILYAKDGKAMQAVDAFGKARKFQRGSVLELAYNGITLVFLKQYKRGLAVLDELVAKLHGRPAGRLLRGLARWMQLLSDPPVDMNRRWMLATDALEDFNVAAGLHGDVPYIFDARADLIFRMAVMAKTRGETQDAERLLRAARKDCDHLIEIGASGGAHVHLAVHKLNAGDLAGFLEYADSAYHVLIESKRRKSFNWRLAFESSIGLRLWGYYVRGDDEVTEGLLRKLQEQHPEFSQSFEFGIVQAGVGDSIELRRDKADLGDPSVGGYGFGLWVGALARGDARLAKHIAGRLSIKLFDSRDLLAALNPSAGVLDKHRWRQVFLGYIKGREDSNALLTASGGSAHRLGLALLTIAMRSKSRESRIDHLRQILRIANPDRSWICARGLLLRCERDGAFLQTAKGNNP